jgi:transcription-repair coupling factor (superfamily II helicase)
LEIRGAGDLLGGSQSGKINEIGFNLYHDLLKRTIEAMRAGKKIDSSLEIGLNVEIETSLPCVIPQSYLEDVHERLVLYKRIASCGDKISLRELQIEMIERFGLLPEATKVLFASAQLRLFCTQIGVQKISIYENKAIIEFSNDTKIDPIRIIKLIQQQAEKFQLKNQNRLIYRTEMPEDIERLNKVQALLSSLGAE